ncbi:uncharacterized protein LOC114289549 [Camellia sinensis]|uniref:uncharacterized protein LOC114289549 n=1 Tax=Camellia sinensis TaxID=4442 RepID=UPI001035951D|nr:uncharacterized protein LOC114289549 [Camellia sinensis]
MTRDKAMFLSLQPKEGGYVTFGDNSKGKIIGTGSIGKAHSPVIENVLLVEGHRHENVYVFDLHNLSSCYDVKCLSAITESDFWNLVCQVMIDAHKRNNQALPYGMIFTKIFKHFKINLKCENKIRRDSAVYGLITLSHIGYYLIDNVWTKTKKPVTAPPTLDPSFSTDPNLPSSSPMSLSTPGPFSSVTLHDIFSLSTKVDHLDSLVQGPLLVGIVELNSKLNNLNLNSQSAPVSNMPSSSQSASIPPSSDLAQKIDQLASMVQQIHSGNGHATRN